MNRWVLKDEQWERVAPLLPGKAGDPGRTGSDNRLFLEAVLWMVRTGAPWQKGTVENTRASDGKSNPLSSAPHQC